MSWMAKGGGHIDGEVTVVEEKMQQIEDIFREAFGKVAEIDGGSYTLTSAEIKGPFKSINFLTERANGKHAAQSV